MSPVSLTSVGVGAGGWIDEVPAVFNIMVDIAVVSEVNVRFPTVGDDRCTRGDILFDDWKKGRLRTGVIRAYHQEATIRTPLNTTKYPAPFNAATTMILALAKLGLVYLDNEPWAPEFWLESEILCHTLSDFKVDVSDRILCDSSMLGGDSRRRIAREFCKDIDELPRGNAALVKDASGPRGDVV